MSSITLPQAVRGFTRGRSLIRLAAIGVSVVAVVAIATGGSGRSTAKGAVLFALGASSTAMMALQGAMLWGYANRLKTLHRTPSLPNVAEAMRWLRYAWTLFLLICVFTLIVASSRDVLKAAIAALAIAPHLDSAKEASALRRIALASAGLAALMACTELIVPVLTERTAPDFETLAATLVGLAIYGAAIWLTWGLARSLGTYAREPSVDALFAASRAYGALFAFVTVLGLISVAGMVVLLLNGDQHSR